MAIYKSRDCDFSFSDDLFETQTGIFYLDWTFDDVSVEDIFKIVENLVVKGLNGKINCQSILDLGTTFEITLTV